MLRLYNNIIIYNSLLQSWNIKIMNNFYQTYLGPHFFGKQKYKYKKPYSNLRNITSKEEICDCPLCHSKNFMMIGKFSIDAIIDTWVKHINFNPIADIYRHSYLEKRRCLNCGLYFYNYHLPDSELLYETLENQPKGYYTQFRAEYGSASEYIDKLKPKSLIELGAGTGNFIDRIKNMVPEILASEYNKEAIKICLQKNIEATSIDVAKIQRKFDVVCAFEVLEHVWDNETFMQNCINLLHKKGKIIFSTPDPEGILAINGNGYLNLPPHHQFDFSYQTFEFLAQKYNLKIVEYKKSELQYRNYARYVENITGMPLTEPDIIGFLETKKQFSGHSHFVIFEKK